MCKGVLFVCLFLLVSADEKDVKKPQFKIPSAFEGDSHVFFTESFSSPDSFAKRWVKSSATRDGTVKYDGEWELKAPSTEGDLEGDVGLVMPTAAKHYAIAAKLDRPFVFGKDKEAFVVQYEVNFQDGITCGGAYIKLLSGDVDLPSFHEKTPYSIMFGPDKCGLTSKVHFIIRFKNPVTGEIEEKHSKQSTESMDFFNDKKTHLFTLLIRNDGVYHIMVDQVPFFKGNLLEDLEPAINPPAEIDDPNDKMPSDWDEREKIPDPAASKPDDWDEDAPAKIPDPDATKPDGWLDEGPEFIADPDAKAPEDWDEEEDGEWEPPTVPNPACEAVGCGQWKPPTIANPAYKGKWHAPLIDNPEYDGKWAPRKIPNPAYFNDQTPFLSLTPITALGLELWTMSNSIYFDNFIVASEFTYANNYAREGWNLKQESEQKANGGMSLGPWIDSFVDVANDYPYLWALYAFALVSPFVICAAFCVRSKSKDDAGRRKKTDESTPDDKKEEKSSEKKSKESEEASGKKDEKKESEDTFVAPAEEGEEAPSKEERDVREGSPSPPGSQPESGGEEPRATTSPKQEEQEETAEAAQNDVPPAANTRSATKRKKTKTRRED
eukprot:Em0022g203a